MYLIVLISLKKKRAIKFLWQKQEVTPVKRGNTWIFMYIIILALIDTNFVAYFVPISTSTPLACTLKLYSWH